MSAQRISQCADCRAFVPAGTCPICDGESIDSDRQPAGGFATEAEMENALDLTDLKEVKQIALTILRLLYVEADSNGESYVSPDKSISGSDFLQEVASTLADRGLAPYDPTSPATPS